MKQNWILAALFIIFFLVVVACSRLTMENYKKIKAGMSYDEVVNVLGKPDKCDDVIGMRKCIWGDEKKSITVSFVGDKALLFSAENIR